MIERALTMNSLVALRNAIMAAALGALLSACAASFRPQPVDSVPFLERTQTQAKDGVRVSVAVPSKDETRKLFGTSLYSRGIQPVWIEIENGTESVFSFLPMGTDADYFSPIEAASTFSRGRAGRQAEQYFFENGVNDEVAPGATRSGFIFTNLDEGTKAFNVDLVGPDDGRQYTFFVPVPGLRIDHHDVDIDALYARHEVEDFATAEDFIAALKTLPCCTTDQVGESLGDPLNLVLIGEPFGLYYSMLRSGWDETEAISAASGFKTAVSFLTGGEYRYSPVSNLYVFGRSQDAAFQKIRKNIHERNHLRVWLAPMTFQGEPVWIGQISRDIGVRFTRKTITTHKIDPDVDETREFLVENLAYHQSLRKLAYVEGVESASIDAPRSNLTGDPYFTDGLRVVLWVGSEPVEIDDIEFIPWIIRQSN